MVNKALLTTIQLKCTWLFHYSVVVLLKYSLGHHCDSFVFAINLLCLSPCSNLCSYTAPTVALSVGFLLCHFPGLDVPLVCCSGGTESGFLPPCPKLVPLTWSAVCVTVLLLLVGTNNYAKYSNVAHFLKKIVIP